MVQILLLLILLFQFVCGFAKAAELTGIDFEKIVFLSCWTRSGKVQLVKGEYREQVAPGSATETVVKVTDAIAFGEMDGKDAAAVILVTDPGGSGSFYDLALLVKNPQGWINQDVAFLGDRIKIHSLAFVNDEIVIDMTSHGPADAMCCPTRRVIQQFILRENRLIATGEEARGKTDQMLTATVWKWQQTLYNNDTRAVAPDPDRYTLKLLSDGKVSIRADCNLGGGVYTLRGSEISIEITRTTRAACPPESLEQSYIRDLNAAAIYSMQGDFLYIDLKYDTGTMKFMR